MLDDLLFPMKTSAPFHFSSFSTETGQKRMEQEGDRFINGDLSVVGNRCLHKAVLFADPVIWKFPKETKSVHWDREMT